MIKPHVYGRQGHSFHIKGTNLVSSLRPKSEDPIPDSAAYYNPAMDYELPRSQGSLWRLADKPCDGFDGDFLTDGDEDSGVPQGGSESTAKLCRGCPVLSSCSREGLATAQQLARMQGAKGRLYGIWGGVAFRGREERARYIKKLDKLFDQIQTTDDTGETTWEPSPSRATTRQSKSA